MSKRDYGFIALLFLLFALAGGADAEAASFGPEENRALAIAEQYWGSPPEKCTSLSTEMVSAQFFAERFPAPAPGSTELWGYATQITELNEPCSIFVQEGLPFNELCATMIHEDGHLHGYVHSTDPNSPMQAQVPVELLEPFCTVPSQKTHNRKKHHKQRRTR